MKTRHPLYATWKAVIQRCEDKNHKTYRWYGARGVTICQEWRNDFEAFVKAVGLKPTPKHSIDRIDNLKGYEPGNCRWATMLEQAANRRENRKLTLQEGTPILSEAARVAGIKRETLAARLNAGWDHNEAVKRPLRSGVKVAFKGEVKTVEEWSKQTGVPGSAIHKRLKRNWPVERALTQMTDRRVQHRA